MATAVNEAPRLSKSGQPTTIKRPSLSDIQGKGSGLPNRYAIHAVEGFGKTSWGAQCPKPIFIETKGETGLETLIDAGRLPETPHFPECQLWEDVLGSIESLLIEPHDYKTLVVDAINGAERLCHEHVCHTQFDDEWGDKGFAGYGRGFEVSLAEWRMFLSALDRLRSERRMAIVLLSHTKVKNFKNPEGADFDRYQPDMNDKTWSLTHKWCDVVLFGNFETTLTAVKTDKKTGTSKGKAIGGQQRIMYTERHAAYDAKNRLGLPGEIDMGNSPAEAWSAFMDAVKAGRGVQANG